MLFQGKIAPNEPCEAMIRHGMPCRFLRWEDGTVTLRVFLLDDHEVVRTGLRALLESNDDIVVVGEAASVAEALARIPATGPTWQSSTSGCPMAAAWRCAGRSALVHPKSTV